MRGFALNADGRQASFDLMPSVERRAVAELLAATIETGRFSRQARTFPAAGARGLQQILAALSVEGRALEALRLVALASFLDSVEETCANIRRDSASFPRLAAATLPAASFKSETTRTRACIDASGDVMDDASAALKGIRGSAATPEDEAARHARVDAFEARTPRSICRTRSSPNATDATSSSSKAEHRGDVPGWSMVRRPAAPACIEPLSTVRINNDIVALQEQEAEGSCSASCSS